MCPSEQCRMLYISVSGGQRPELASVPNGWIERSEDVSPECLLDAWM